MTGTEAAEALEGLARLVRARAECTADELVGLLAMALGVRSAPTEPAHKSGPRGGMSNAEKCRRHRKRHRDTEPTPVATPPTRVVPVSPTRVATPQTTPNDTTPTPVGPPLASPPFRSGSSGFSEKTTTTDPEMRAHETGVATPKPTPVVRRPRNLGEALALPLLDRAAMLWQLRDSSFDAEVFCAGQWPELQALAQAFRDATGMKHEKAGPWPDPRTKRLVELLATPHLPSELKTAFEALPRSSWWSNPDKRRHGLAGISPRVLAGVLTEADEPRAARMSPQEIERLFEEPEEKTHATA